MQTARRLFGDQAESFVAQTLTQQGFVIRERNYQKLYGEIDIIAQKSDLLIFVEVKVRHHTYVAMHEIVTRSKQRKIALVAKEYMSRHKIIDKICRFDVALVQAQGEQFALEYIDHAFVIDR